VTDIKTTWTEIRAIWNKGASDVVKQTQDDPATLCGRPWRETKGI